MEKETFRKEILKLKEELKTKAIAITLNKNAMRNNQRNGKDCWKEQCEVIRLKYLFRHKHIAYCELRGRTREQIEPVVREGNDPDETLIQSFKEKFLAKTIELVQS